MVRAIRPDGRLDLVPIGTWSARFAEGGRVTVFTEEPDGILTGTALPCKASGHAFGDEIDEQPASWDNPAVRPDVCDTDPAALPAPGARGGCFVAFAPHPVAPDEGFVVSPHLPGHAA